MEHDGNIPFIELAFSERPGGILEDDGGCSGGVIDDGDFVEVVGIDEALEEGA
jgi:hypothetical protein